MSCQIFQAAQGLADRFTSGMDSMYFQLSNPFSSKTLLHFLPQTNRTYKISPHFMLLNHAIPSSGLSFNPEIDTNIHEHIVTWPCYALLKMWSLYCQYSEPTKRRTSAHPHCSSDTRKWECSLRTEIAKQTQVRSDPSNTHSHLCVTAPVNGVSTGRSPRQPDVSSGPTPSGVCTWVTYFICGCFLNSKM